MCTWVKRDQLIEMLNLNLSAPVPVSRKCGKAVELRAICIVFGLTWQNIHQEVAPPKAMKVFISDSSWWFFPTHLKNVSH